MYTEIIEASKKGNLAKVKQLIDKGVDVNAKTPLHYAATHSDSFFVDLLISKRAEINVKANDGMAPIDFALRQNRLDLDNVQLLIEKGADIKIWSMDITFFNKLGLYYYRLLGKFFK